ncbi:MAG: [FeFe] hydrogenase H-cluster radical SAM maturase HydG [Brevinema sp.]
MVVNKIEILDLIEKLPSITDQQIEDTLSKARLQKGLTHQDVAILLAIEKPEHKKDLFSIAEQIKTDTYGKRIVIFAPLYISDYCVNSCSYCGYKIDNKFPRRRLTQDELAEQAIHLLKMGHKRVALEAGEDPVNCDIDYVLECLDTIYDTKSEYGSIRRVNVNVAATTVENYKKLHEAGIGTYILFQETYDEEAYRLHHTKGPKSNFEYHLNAMDRAMEAGIDDVGGGILFGLADHRFEILALMMHNEYLEEKYHAGFHTVSVPRLKKADGMNIEDYPHLVDDETFKKIVAIIRMAVPFAGLILSTRETVEMRAEVIRYGVSQVSSGSCTGVGAYQDEFLQTDCQKSAQFAVSDERNCLEVNKWLLEDDQLPSYCTACYRNGRTGEDFMHLSHSGQIQLFCQPNSLLTLLEYSLDFGDDEFQQLAQEKIDKELKKMPEDRIKKATVDMLKKVKQGERDLYI